MKSYLWLIIIIGLNLGLSSCKKKCKEPMHGNLHFNLRYNIDLEELHPDTIRYTNFAGNQYSVTRLEYYISGFTFRRSDGMSFYTNKAYYVDAFSATTGSINIDSIPYGHYSEVTFHIGLPPTLNISYFLPNTLENINMSWPDAMGGGYHFLKLEGKVFTSAGSLGYAMHLGNNESLVNIKALISLDINSEMNSLEANMNINEWYRDPNTYDILVDGNHIMGNQPLMTKFAANGYNVFSFR
jgi:hypothetical protein